MKVLHILKSAPDRTTERIIEAQKSGNQVTTVDLTKGPISYDDLVALVFSHDKVFCW